MSQTAEQSSDQQKIFGRQPGSEKERKMWHRKRTTEEEEEKGHCNHLSRSEQRRQPIRPAFFSHLINCTDDHWPH